MPLNWNDEQISSKADQTTDKPGLKEIGGVVQLIYHPFRFAGYDFCYNDKYICAYPVCKPALKASFPAGDNLTGKELLISLCNLAKVIDSFENRIPKEQLIIRWCTENMHPYNIGFLYSKFTENFDIYTIDAELVEREGVFEIDRFMKDLEKLYNAARFYVALERITYADDSAAYSLYEAGRYFESSFYFEKYQHAAPHIPADAAGEADTPQKLHESTVRTKKYITEHPVEQQPDGAFDFIHNSHDSYDELHNSLANFIPEFNMKLKFNTAAGRFELSADADSVFDIAWYTLAAMISEDPSLGNRTSSEPKPEGILICCRNCGKFIIRKSSRQEFCDAEECQKARNARKQKAYRERKAFKKAHAEQKKTQR